MSEREMTKEELMQHLFKFGDASNGYVAAQHMRFLKDGAISGYWNFKERFWEIKDNQLILMNMYKTPTSHFSLSVESGSLRGMSAGGETSLFLEPEDLVFNYRKREDRNVSYGNNTYGTLNIVTPLVSGQSVFVGNFTSIAQGVQVIRITHDYKQVTTYPFNAQAYWWINTDSGGEYCDNLPWDIPFDLENKLEPGLVNIGSDVWIGKDVTIMGGVTIGDGAVIGANATVTKDVKPYEIVGGVPAHHIKFRFTENQIEGLLKIKWWNWEIKLLDERMKNLVSLDIDDFIEKYK